MTSGSFRLFVAISVPDDHLEWLEAENASLRHLWPSARWIPRPSQHITLKFLGATPEDRLAEVTAACSRVASAHERATVRLGELGAFPNVRRARVLWVGVEDPGGLLPALASHCDRELEPLGYPPEERAYSPHLTLARFKTPLRLGELPALGHSPGPFPVDDLVLWRSHLSPKGARYERVLAFPLGPQV